MQFSLRAVMLINLLQYSLYFVRKSFLCQSPAIVTDMSRCSKIRKKCNLEYSHTTGRLPLKSKSIVTFKLLLLHSFSILQNCTSNTYRHVTNFVRTNSDHSIDVKKLLAPSEKIKVFSAVERF